MGYIEGENRHQSVLFPETLDDYIGNDNPVRFIDAYVDQLDLADFGFTHAIPCDTGRPPYEPGVILKLYLYGYLNKIRSSRMLEKATQRNVELMWLLRKLTPDFKTIADFRKDNAPCLKQVFRNFTILCKDLELFGCELIGIDGSKFSAVNHTQRNYTKKKLHQRLAAIEQTIQEYLARLDHEDTNESSVPPIVPGSLHDKIAHLEQYQHNLEQLQKHLDESGQTQISLTDPDSRLMRTGQQGKDMSYNVQVAVDAKHKLIAEFDVTNDANDQNQLSRMVIKAKEALGVQQLAVTADMGYYKELEIKRCHDEGVTCYVPYPTKSTNSSKGLFTNKDFRYDREHDCYFCPANQQMTYRTACIKSGKQMKFYEGNSCKQCNLRVKCTRSKSNNRRIERWVHEDVLDEARQRMLNHPEMMDRRKEIVEHPFGTIKQWMDQRYLLLRGKLKVTGEMSLSMLAYNMKRVLNIVGVDELIHFLKPV